MKTAISIPDALFDAADGLARRLGLSRSDLYQRALGAYLDAQRYEGVREGLDAVYAADADASSIDEGLKRMQAASLPKDEW